MLVSKIYASLLFSVSHACLCWLPGPEGFCASLKDIELIAQLREPHNIASYTYIDIADKLKKSEGRYAPIYLALTYSYAHCVPRPGRSQKTTPRL